MHLCFSVASNTLLGSFRKPLLLKLGIWFYIEVSLSARYQFRIQLTEAPPDHEFGGHFAGLDNPPALIEDLSEIGNFWEL
jgi:hypothetical protein